MICKDTNFSTNNQTLDRKVLFGLQNYHLCKVNNKNRTDSHRHDSKEQINKHSSI